MSPSQAVDLIDDVLYGVYNHIWIWDLIKLRLVSKRWDATIREHPYYWKDLVVKVTTPSAIDSFVTRLAASHRRPVEIYAEFGELQDAGPSPDQHGVVYDALTSHMDHIASLTLSGTADYASQIFAVLSHAAPVLETLCIAFRLRHDNLKPHSLESLAPLTLPSDLLSGDSPVLRDVKLVDVMLGGQRLRCFANATKVSITNYHRVHHELPFLPTWFPRSTVLEIGGDVTCKNGERDASRSWNAIEHLILRDEAAEWHAVSLGGPGRQVTYYEWYYNVLENVQQRLIGPLTLVVDATDLRWMQADLKSTVDGCTRSFRHQSRTWWEVRGVFYDMRSVFAYAPLMERVIFLVCSQRLLDRIAHLFAPMTALETLVVTFHDFDPFAYFHDGAGVRDSTVQKARLVCPRLERLVIRWDAAKLSGSTEDVARVIVEGLECSAFPSVTVEGLEDM
ncbi:hypothetical protein EXIGLDRAFT_727436 [Exidia glandulosa HHB12029]|uniref:F-box domain-containing protein n=1 Tax=Exidia glandulosa HHB12029 TaxID=1314781 RepID=A0A165ZN78_EXIGL|nr:hypothetical protein EXIGLDRAFT_727436 [Exidia glandulosa HHB12029]